MQTIRSIIFTAVLFLSVVPFSFAVILARPFGVKASYKASMGWFHTVSWFCKVLCRLDFAIEGKENIPQTSGIVFMKHSSAYETITAALVLPRLTWVLKRELMWAPFLGWALACINSIAIDRNSHRIAIAQIIKQGRRRLAEGMWIMIFPEGTRMRAGETRRYGVSGTLLAQATNTLILPVAHNAGDFWPRRGWRKRPGTVRFVIGKPVDPAGRGPREVNAEIQDWIEAKVNELRSMEVSNNP
jgi:1-acyl-sn-glycerol-3-phosphate acyltransferase